VGYYHAADMPLPNANEPLPTNHREAIKRANVVETPQEAKTRIAQGGARPAHYIAAREIRE